MAPRPEPRLRDRRQSKPSSAIERERTPPHDHPEVGDPLTAADIAADQTARDDANQAMADAYGWPLDEVEANVAAAAAFGELGAAMAAMFPETYAGGWIDNNVNGAQVLNMAFTTSTPPDFDGRGLSIRFHQRPYPLHVLQGIADQVAAELAAGGRRDFNAYADVERGRAIIDLPSDVAIPDAARTPAADVNRQDGIRSEPNAVVGGARTWYSQGFPGDFDDFICTTGYSVGGYAIGHRTGFMTAGHCLNNRYGGGTDGPIITTTLQNQSINTFSDFEWHTTADTETNWVVGQMVRTVRPYSSVMTGQPVLFFGRRHDYIAPGTIHQVGNICGEIGNMSTDTFIGEQGDSGGPLYTTGTAIGIHYRECLSDNERDLFFPIDKMDNTVTSCLSVLALDRMTCHQRLTIGQTIVSPGSAYRLTMQSDGNLVMYTGATGGVATWAQGVSHPGSFAEMQTDGNFVLYRPTGNPIWASGTSFAGSLLRVQDDGNLVVYDTGGVARWADN